MILGRKKLLALVFAAAVSSMITAAAYIYYDTATIYKTMELGMDVYVDRHPGLNVDADAVHFGKVPPGAGGSRRLTVTAGEYPTVVSFEHYGDIAQWTSVSENDIFLNPQENATVSIHVSVPEDVVPLAYRNGTLRIVFRRALL